MAGTKYDPLKDYYRVLDIAPNATQEELRRAFRQQAKRFHPDVNPERLEWAKANFQLVNDAYRVLGDPKLREAYDRQRRFYEPFSFSSASQPAPPNESHASSSDDYQRPRTPPPPYTTRPPRAQQPPRTSTPKVRVVNDLWLEQWGLGKLRPLYRRIMSRVESPYQYILAIIGILMVFNILFIANSFATQDSVVPARTTVDGSILTATSTPTIAAPVPFIAHDTCSTPLVRILIPESSQLRATDLPLQIRGRVAHPDMFTYALELVGRQGQGSKQVKPPSTTLETPIQDIGTLGALLPRHFAESGSYDLYLTVFDADGNGNLVEVSQCEVRYQFDADS